MGRKIKRKHDPQKAMRAVSPTGYYDYDVCWGFSNCDKEMWPVFKNGQFADKAILEFLQLQESRKWKDLLISAKKNNHSIDVDDLNKRAIDRLTELRIEANSIIVLHMSGKRCLYGHIVHGIFYLIWYDDDHGDNDTCVCRSKKKNT